MSTRSVWTYGKRTPDMGDFDPASPEEAARVAGLLDADKAQDVLHARRLMRGLLACEFGINAAAVTLDVFDDAPPRVEGLDDVAVSWSRSGPHALAAFRRGGRIGADIEQAVPVRMAPLLDMIASEEERAIVNVAGPSEAAALAALYRLWCAKEAVLKWRGTGLRGGAKTVSVPAAFIRAETSEISIQDNGLDLALQAIHPAETCIAVLAFSG